MITLISSKNYVHKCIPKDEVNVICDANYEDFNITEEFQYLSSTLPSDAKELNRLDLYNSYIEELPENVFHDISFAYVIIYYCTNLSKIHSNAFTNSINNLRHLYFSWPTNLRNDPPDYDLYKALNSLVNVEDIWIILADNYSHEIPDSAFNKPQNRLTDLHMYNNYYDFNTYNISKIGSKAFAGLTALTWLSIGGAPILNISSRAFEFTSNSNISLSVELSVCNISDKIIENNAFSGAKRPLNIQLSINDFNKCFIN